MVSGDNVALASAEELTAFLAFLGLVEFGEHEGQNRILKKQFAAACSPLQIQETAIMIPTKRYLVLIMTVTY